jgi:hypothetical protein
MPECGDGLWQKAGICDAPLLICNGCFIPAHTPQSRRTLEHHTSHGLARYLSFPASDGSCKSTCTYLKAHLPHGHLHTALCAPPPTPTSPRIADLLASNSLFWTHIFRPLLTTVHPLSSLPSIQDVLVTPNRYPSSDSKRST